METKTSKTNKTLANLTHTVVEDLVPRRHQTFLLQKAHAGTRLQDWKGFKEGFETNLVRLMVSENSNSGVRCEVFVGGWVRFSQFVPKSSLVVLILFSKLVANDLLFVLFVAILSRFQGSLTICVQILKFNSVQDSF